MKIIPALEKILFRKFEAPLAPSLPPLGEGRLGFLCSTGKSRSGYYSIIATGAPQRRGKASGAPPGKMFSPGPIFRGSPVAFPGCHATGSAVPVALPVDCGHAATNLHPVSGDERNLAA